MAPAKLKHTNKTAQAQADEGRQPFQINVTAEEKELLIRAAAREYLPLATWIRARILLVARAELAQDEAAQKAEKKK